MQKVIKIAGIALKALLIALVALFLVYDICVIVQKYAMGRDMPQFFGYTSAVIVSDSMYPEICRGDLIIIDVNCEYGVDDVVMYYDSTSDVYVTHRIIASNGTDYFTKGDNSDSADNITVTESMIVGKVVAVWGGVGNFISFIQQPLGMVTVILIAVLVIVLAHLIARLISLKQQNSTPTPLNPDDINRDDMDHSDMEK